MNSRKLLIGCGVALLGLGVVILGIIASSFFPSVDQQFPPGRGSILVNISLPLNGAQLPLNQPVSVYVNAFGDQPLQDIQLLVDGVLQPNGSSSPAGEKKMIAAWAFTADKEGAHTFLARVNTRNGQTGISNAVTVNVLPPDQLPLPLVQGGAATPQVINDETSGADFEGGTPGSPPPGFNDQGGVINPPPPFPTEPPSQEPPAEPSQQPGDNLIPIKYALWFQNLFGASLPAAPKLDGGANQCAGILVAQDNSADELGFFLYRLDPGQQAFSRIATLDGKAGKAAFSYHDPGLASGLYLYYLSAFNSAGETASNLIGIIVNAPLCAMANKPKFDAESIPIDIGQPVDKAYCYGSASGMPWVRLPYGQNNFIYPVNNKIDLAPYWNLIPLPQPIPPQVTLNMECWGWSGSTLVYLGTSSQTFGGGGAPKPNPDGEPPPPPPPSQFMVANPYNLHISNDPNECQAHAPNNPGAVQDCKDYLASKGGSFLFWDYSQYGNCNPQTQTCYMEYQPADHFHIYHIKAGVVSYFVGMGLNFHYEPGGPTPLDTGEYWVRADSYKYGESGDSNHVDFVYQGKVLETTIDPTYVQTHRWLEKNDGSAPYWYMDPGVGPGELISGYAFICLNNCAEGKYADSWYNGLVQFLIPDNIYIKNARLNWKNMWYTTSGPGANDVILSCQVRLVTMDSGMKTLSNSSLGGIENYDVTQPVLKYQMNGQPSIEFWFMAPMNKKPGVRSDRCLWFINNLSLTLYYYP